MLTVQAISRKFIINRNGNDLTLPDPNPLFPPDQVMSFYANTYAELTNSVVSGPSIKDDELIYIFKSTLGTKG